MITLANGSPIFVFVREGVVYIPNPELAKILPVVSRTAMENIRTTYGITVYQVCCMYHQSLQVYMYIHGDNLLRGDKNISVFTNFAQTMAAHYPLNFS